jgi:thiamine biosynthesis lipoprotein
MTSHSKATEARRARPLLGTVVDIRARMPADGDAHAAIDAAFSAVARVHRLMSYHDAESDVSRVNRASLGSDLAVDAWTYAVFCAARNFSEASDGLFDITVAPELARLGLLPRRADLPRVRGCGDWRHIELRPGHTIRLQRRVRVDLGGIAKGYAVDRAIAALREAGAIGGYVNAGGDLRRFGDGVDAISVRLPLQPDTVVPLLEIGDAAVATSATYGAPGTVPVSPHISPRAREAHVGNVSVSVLAADCLSADALTKVVLADACAASAVLARFDARALVMRQDAAYGEYQLFDSHNGSLPALRVSRQAA